MTQICEMLEERGIKVIFPDVDRIAQKLLDELAKK